MKGLGDGQVIIRCVIQPKSHSEARGDPGQLMVQLLSCSLKYSWNLHILTMIWIRHFRSVLTFLLSHRTRPMFLNLDMPITLDKTFSLALFDTGCSCFLTGWTLAEASVLGAGFTDKLPLQLREEPGLPSGNSVWAGHTWAMEHDWVGPSWPHLKKEHPKGGRGLSAPWV